nr:hypothetical protein Itr_chr02CG25160 [Ipomoea trifida]GMC61764.1 hypothetical protein Iba_chr02bCG23150 [Ipomoea batatas]
MSIASTRTGQTERRRPEGKLIVTLRSENGKKVNIIVAIREHPEWTALFRGSRNARQRVRRHGPVLIAVLDNLKSHDGRDSRIQLSSARPRERLVVVQTLTERVPFPLQSRDFGIQYHIIIFGLH